jgi:hypothetical protein
MRNEPVRLKYEGKFDWIKGENRQWTITSHFIDVDGNDRYRGTFSLEGLVKLGIVRIRVRGFVL